MTKKRAKGGRLSTDESESRRWATRTDSADAFMPDPEEGRAQIDDDIAETLAEDFLQAATSGQDITEEAQDAVVDEELGGPFIVTNGSVEFARGTDDSNPEDATREAMPRATAAMVQPAYYEEAVDSAEADDDDDEMIDDEGDLDRTTDAR